MELSDVFVPIDERFSIFDCEKVVQHDFVSLVTPDTPEAVRSKIASRNLQGYYVCINTWVLMVTDMASERLGNLLRSVIRSEGLVSTIDLCAKSADLLVDAIHASPQLDSSSPVSFAFPECNSVVGTELLYRMRSLPHKLARQLLVFPKRFAPVVPAEHSVLHLKAIETFEEVNRADAVIARKLYSLRARVVTPPERALPFKDSDIEPRWQAIAAIARTIFHWVVGRFPGMSSQEYPRIGPGACRNAGRSLIERLEKMAAYGEYRLSIPPSLSVWHGKIGRYLCVHPDTREREYIARNGRRRHTIKRGPRCARGFWGFRPGTPQVCRVTSVPKKWNAVRLIAIEDVCNMSRQLYLKDLLMERFEHHMLGVCLPLRDQDQNRELARLAAESDKLSTLDLSHASDSVTKALVWLLSPDDWWYGFQSCIPFGYILDEKDEREKPLHVFATMGCGCTFPVEALVFLVLTLATILFEMGCSAAGVIAFIKNGNLDWLLALIRVMGDDIILPSLYEDAVISTLTYFGFEVNRSKSFSHGRFRESCGADWCRLDDGSVESLTCLYWPRIPIRGSASPDLAKQASEYDERTMERYVTCGLMRLTSLQQRLLPLSSSASQFLCDWIGYYFPDLSTSFPGESDDVPWSLRSRVDYLWYINTERTCCDQSDGSSVGKTVGGPELVTYESALRFYLEQYNGPGTEPDDPTIASAIWRSVNLAMKCARRRVFRAPCLTVADTNTGFNPCWSEAIYLELSLRRLADPADAVPSVFVHEVNTQVTRHFALGGARPTRLSGSKLLAESYIFSNLHLVS